MTVTPLPPPRELGRTVYAPAGGLGISSSIATHGAGLINGSAQPIPWALSFTTTAARPDVDIYLTVPFVSNSGANDTVMHVLVDGTCRYEDTVKAASTHGRRSTGSAPVTGLSAGDHTATVQMSVSAGAGALAAAATNPGVLAVREVG